MKYLGILLLVVLFSASTYAQTQGQSTTLQYTKHWFVSAAWNQNPVLLKDGTTHAPTEACQPCHVPHRKLGTDYGTLWNHTMSTASYTSDNPETTPDGSWYPIQPSSQKCLSCHDGEVALGAFGGATGNGTKMGSYTTPTYNPNLGTTLSDDHPISYQYCKDSVLSATRSFWPATGTSGNTYTIGSASLRLASHSSNPATPVVTGIYTVECSTCHSAHGKAPSTALNSPYSSLLRMSNAGSALCLTCHKK